MLLGCSEVVIQPRHRDIAVVEGVQFRGLAFARRLAFRRGVDILIGSVICFLFLILASGVVFVVIGTVVVRIVLILFIVVTHIDTTQHALPGVLVCLPWILVVLLHNHIRVVSKCRGHPSHSNVTITPHIVFLVLFVRVELEVLTHYPVNLLQEPQELGTNFRPRVIQPRYPHQRDVLVIIGTWQFNLLVVFWVRAGLRGVQCCCDQTALLQGVHEFGELGGPEVAEGVEAQLADASDSERVPVCLQEVIPERCADMRDTLLVGGAAAQEQLAGYRYLDMLQQRAEHICHRCVPEQRHALVILRLICFAGAQCDLLQERVKCLRLDTVHVAGLLVAHLQSQLLSICHDLHNVLCCLFYALCQRIQVST